MTCESVSQEPERGTQQAAYTSVGRRSLAVRPAARGMLSKARERLLGGG